MTVDTKLLLKKAFAARDHAYAPYSGMKVGAALLCTDNSIELGCNIENAAWSPSLCAERVALSLAVSKGKLNFAAIAIIGGPAGKTAPYDEYFWPCGVCRQALAEFCDDDFIIIAAKSMEDYVSHTLVELLPERFSPRFLQGP